MARRKRTPEQIEAEVLIKCRRRCCLCYGVDGDLETKHGQIAHLDRDRSNSAANNLVFLCLRHHDDYDTRHSQSKGYSLREVAIYREQLWEAISLERHLKRKATKQPTRVRHIRNPVDKITAPVPRAVLLAAWSELEKSAVRCVNRLVLRDRNAPLDPGLVIALITRMEMVSESVSGELHQLWHLRNLLVHGVPFVITADDASDFRRRASKVMTALDAA